MPVWTRSIRGAKPSTISSLSCQQNRAIRSGIKAVHESVADPVAAQGKAVRMLFDAIPDISGMLAIVVCKAEDAFAKDDPIDIGR